MFKSYKTFYHPGLITKLKRIQLIYISISAYAFKNTITNKNHETVLTLTSLARRVHLLEKVVQSN